jgi:membrane protease YdiL (CAAX protease family)
MRWLKKEVTGKKFFLCVAAFLGVRLLYALGCCAVANLLGINIPPVSRGKVPILTLSFPFFLLTAVFLEESLFRLPLAILIQRGWRIGKILVSALILSILFGLYHGSIHHIFVQGIGGFIYSILFLKCGGLQKNYQKALCTTTITHFLFNTIIIIIALAQGVTEV